MEIDLFRYSRVKGVQKKFERALGCSWPKQNVVVPVETYLTQKVSVRSKP